MDQELARKNAYRAYEYTKFYSILDKHRQENYLGVEITEEYLQLPEVARVYEEFSTTNNIPLAKIEYMVKTSKTDRNVANFDANFCRI